MSKPSKLSIWLLKDLHWLFILCILLPIFFLVLIEFSRGFYLTELMSIRQERVTIIAIVTIGVIVFSTLVFATIRRLQKTSDEQRKQLRALNEIGLKLATEHQFDDIIETVLKSACTTVDVTFGILATTNNSGEITSFITCCDNDCRKKNDGVKDIQGVLGAIINDGRSLLINNMHRQPHLNIFFDGHPSVQGLIGVPIISKSRVIGAIYLCNPSEHSQFTHEDLSALSLLASHAAVAVDNAHIYERLSRLSILEERQRIAMDLHDGAIQSLYALGLQLEFLTEKSKNSLHGYINVDGARDRVKKAITDINLVIKDLRNYISELNQNDKKKNSISAAIQEESIRLRAHGITEIDIDICSNLSVEEDCCLFSIERALHECVSNVIRHSEATSVRISVTLLSNECSVQVQDNGVGVDLETIDPKIGFGLDNIRFRLSELNGRLELAATPGKGYSISLIVPVTSDG